MSNRKVQLSLCSPQLSTTPWRRIGGVEVQIHAFFDLDTRWWWVGISTNKELHDLYKSPSKM